MKPLAVVEQDLRRIAADTSKPLATRAEALKILAKIELDKRLKQAEYN